MTIEQFKACLGIMESVADAVREAGEAPSGVVYTAFMANGLSLETYRSVLDLLVDAKLIQERGHTLRWVGPVDWRPRFS